MKISIRMFLFAMAFGLLLSCVYWFDTGEPAGTIFLGFMGMGFVWVTSYLIGTRKTTRYDGDDEKAPAELAGEHVAVVSTESPWPIILALATAAFLIGTVLHPMLGLFAVLGFFVILWQLVREST
ncbi:MAG: cytochrome c oxidase subunit 4 [Candidatus Eremiobacteraeota bacterium]|nr:cytochrome c oxidase subunit 4 [Candidatus Eremiobacteraeota bacterium]